ncbi:MAG: amino acid permease [Desulfobulbaceae bacterium]|nr:MAG: amino acid permease [Desulfobulbaceae bacterium]
MANQKNQFGTFGGVFTPAILTILGVIMFMRANFVVGHGGVINAILILVFAKLITLTTSFSISAVSTNMEVRGGGSYFLISRVLGVEFGGAIGVALFFALALSVPFYILGFSEALVFIYPELTPFFQHITLAAAVVLFLVAFFGAGLAIKTQYLIMLFLGLAIFAFMAGGLSQFSMARLTANLGAAPPGAGEQAYSFWMLFALYFPAVTGIDAGVNMSGDLKDPGRSIPRGTLAAVSVGFVVYLCEIVISGGAYDRQMMIAEPFGVLQENAIFGWGMLVALGVVAATLSSALSSYLGAPRVLQAVSRDRLLGILRPFAKGAAKGDEPRRALILTAVITLLVLLWAGNSSSGGALNAVAAIITMFFLYTYGMINLAAFIEDFSGNPSFRPTFRYFHWTIALAGGCGAIFVSFLINWLAALAALAVISFFLWYLHTRQLRSVFGDARRGFLFHHTRNNLYKLHRLPDDSKNWRPTVLIFSGKPSEREDLIVFSTWIEARRGLVYLANVLIGDFHELVPRRRAAIQQLTTFCHERNFEAFPLVVMAEDMDTGISMLLQATATGPIHPNLAVFGWSHPQERIAGYVSGLRTAASLDMSLVLLETESHPSDIFSGSRRIDVWWRGQKNGGLMLLLAYLLTENWEWQGATIRVLRLVGHEEGVEPATTALQELIDRARVDATAQTICSDQPFAEVLHTHSGDAACTILGFELPAEGEEVAWHRSNQHFIEQVPTVMLVNSQGGESLFA